uniref:Calpain catalytic domain-containing protein n=1 Tax=Macrostomum lignano TaxID=282301 RepID=A0A1I8FMC9_9PLAT
MHGDYASLSRGRVVDALASFVRGIPEHWDLRQMRQPGAEKWINPDSPDDQAQLAKQFLHSSKQALSDIPDNRTTRMGDWTKESLVYGRGYILTDIQQTKLKDGKTPVTLMMFQNAWFDMEWTGAWSDGSPEWRSVTLEFKDKIGLVDSKDGIFCIGDVLKQFTDVDICVVTGVGSIRSWLIYTFHNEWTAEQVGRGGRRRSVDYSAGGSYEYKDTYASNPQATRQPPASRTGQLEIGMDLFRIEVNRKSRIKAAPREALLALRVKPERQPGVLMKARFEPGNYLMMPADLCNEDKKEKDTFYVDFKVLLYRHQLLDPIDIEITKSYIFATHGISAALLLSGESESACPAGRRTRQARGAACADCLLSSAWSSSVPARRRSSRMATGNTVDGVGGGGWWQWLLVDRQSVKEEQVYLDAATTVWGIDKALEPDDDNDALCRFCRAARTGGDFVSCCRAPESCRRPLKAAVAP